MSAASSARGKRGKPTVGKVKSLRKKSAAASSAAKAQRQSGPQVSRSAQKAIQDIVRTIESRGSVGDSPDLRQRPHYGTTVFIADCALEMRMGTFHAYVFQDLIHKGYIIAIAYGDIHRADLLYTRLHSSCVTSETLRGCDCDCSKQLEGALRTIADRGVGILFYLIQEGRGVGYVAKARDRMLVQAAQDELSTFEAYALMGLRKDYRNYEGIASIIHLLGVKAAFRVLTNNPDKVNALKSLGVRVDGTETIEFDAGPYNLAYLKSKAQSGHQLKRTKDSMVRRAIPPEPVVPFNPYTLPEAGRFIYCASYFLPMKPVDGEVLVARKEFERVAKRIDIDRYRTGPQPLIRDIAEMDAQRVLIVMDRKNLAAYRANPKHVEIEQLVTTPYWFRVHAYYDVATGQDFVVLTHGLGKSAQPAGSPIVRIHSESIFDRFPLRDVENRDKLKASAKLIMRHGSGMIVLLYNDGRGAGFGAHATDRMLRERDIAATSDETYEILGVPYDSRDYDAAMMLIAHHAPERRIQMIMNSPDSLVRKQEYAIALHRQRLEVERWIFLDEGYRG